MAALAMAERTDPRTPTLFGSGDGTQPVRDDGVGGEPTLDEIIVGAWEGLAAQVAVACPLCAEGLLRPLARPVGRAGGAGDRDAADGARAALGRCDRCGAQLA
jgi:hypothetical protein